MLLVKALLVSNYSLDGNFIERMLYSAGDLP